MKLKKKASSPKKGLSINFNPKKDFICLVGDNNSGKTQFILNFWLKNLDLDNVYVLNSSRESSWKDFGIPERNIIKPVKFTTKWFDVFLLDFVSNHSNCVLVIDDSDNYSVKESEVLKSVVINARHMGISIILAARGLQSIPRILYKQAHYLCLGNQNVRYDTIYISFVIGEAANKLADLQKFEFMLYDLHERKYNFVKLKL